MVHVILGVRPPAKIRRLGSDSQDLMDQIRIMQKKGKGSVDPGKVLEKVSR
jgi:hypothetical protein